MNMTDLLVSVSRDALLDAALDLLALEGPPSPANVARTAGVSKALVFHHFRSVEGLHDAIAEKVLRETQGGLDALAQEYPNPRERLHALARALLAEPPETPAESLHVLRFWLAGNRAPVRSPRDNQAASPRGAVRDGLVTDFVRATLKEMRWPGDAARVASMILARWHGATIVYATGSIVDFEAEAERASAELDRMLAVR